MKAIILDKPIRTSKSILNSDYSSLFSPVLNVPLIVRYIKGLKAQGVKQITILTDQAVPADMRDGSPWDVQLSYARKLTSKDIEQSKENWIMLPGNVILDMDYTKFEIWHNTAKSTVSRAIPRLSQWSLPSQYFHPTIFSAETLKNGLLEKRSLTSAALQNLVNRLHQKQFSVQLVESVGGLTSNQDYWEAHQSHYKQGIDKDSLQGFPLMDKLWIDLNTRVDKSVENIGFTLIGKNCKINRGVKFKGFVVIGDDVIIDCETTIENSIIKSNTYIGSDVHLRNAIVNQNRLYRADYDSMLKVEENWLIGSNTSIDSSKWFNRKINTPNEYVVTAE